MSHPTENDAAYWRGRAEAAEARLRRRQCGCAWCCATTPPDQRGETHKRTCQPRVVPPGK